MVASQPKWGKHRRVINKAFHRKAINSYRSKMVQSSKAFTEKLEGEFRITRLRQQFYILLFFIFLKTFY